MPYVSVIIVAFNSKKIIADTIKSVLNQTYHDLEIIFVDNNSTDGTYEFIKESFPNVMNIKLNKNLGFAGGNNLAVQYASGEYIALLNPDAVADFFWVEELVKAMDAHPDTGICASKLVVFRTNVIDSAGDGFLTSLRGFKRGEGLSSHLYNKEEYVFGACAGAAIYRRTMLDEIGFLDEDFFLIHEDTDLNFRAQLAGWKVMYVPSAIVYHKVRSTIGHMSDFAIYYSLRNSELIRFKNVPFDLFLRCIPSYVIGVVLEFLYFVIRHRKLRPYMEAKIDAIKLFPKMLKKRKDIMSNKKADNRYLYSIMTPLWHKEFFFPKAKKFLKG